MTASLAELPHRLDLEPAAAHWQLALDAAQHALGAASATLVPAELDPLRHELATERQETAALLARVARGEGVRPVPWLSPVPLDHAMLGLPAGVRACVFDVDGVLADSGAMHALAWAEVLDPLLLRLSEEAGWEFVPFDRVADYREYVDGRSRDEGVRAFLASRGIHLRDDAVAALARGKGEALTRARHRRRVGALPGARRYLEAAGRAGLPRAVVSTSTSTRATLELAGLTPVIDEVVDGEVARADALRPRPAPDLLLAACRRVGVDPAAAVTLTRTPAGVAAGHAAGLHVIGVGAGKRAELLGGFGAGQVVPSLGALLDRRLAS